MSIPAMIESTMGTEFDWMSEMEIMSVMCTEKEVNPQNFGEAEVWDFLWILCQRAALAGG